MLPLLSMCSQCAQWLFGPLSPVSRVQDFGNLVLILVVNFHRRRRCNFAVRNGAGFVGFELRNIEDGVDGAHIGRELDPDGVGTGASDDLVRAKVLLRELLRRSTSLNKLSKKEDFGSDRKLWGRHPVTIRRDLVTLLSFGDRFLDLGVDTGDKGPNTHWAHCEHIESIGKM